jgi:hypothetical protein
VERQRSELWDMRKFWRCAKALSLKMRLKKRRRELAANTPDDKILGSHGIEEFNG